MSKITGIQFCVTTQTQLFQTQQMYYLFSFFNNTNVNCNMFVVVVGIKVFINIDFEKFKLFKLFKCSCKIANVLCIEQKTIRYEAWIWRSCFAKQMHWTLCFAYTIVCFPPNISLSTKTLMVSRFLKIWFLWIRTINRRYTLHKTDEIHIYIHQWQFYWYIFRLKTL